MVAGWGAHSPLLPLLSRESARGLWPRHQPGMQRAGGLTGKTCRDCGLSGVENSAGAGRAPLPPPVYVAPGGDSRDSVAPWGEGGGEIGPWVCEGPEHSPARLALSLGVPQRGGGGVQFYTAACTLGNHTEGPLSRLRARSSVPSKFSWGH